MKLAFINKIKDNNIRTINQLVETKITNKLYKINAYIKIFKLKKYNIRLDFELRNINLI